MKRGILTENAELAWRAALVYRDLLLDGRDTVQNKKNFVTSLHNAVELYSKQKMIFDNNFTVATVKDSDSQASFAKRYYSADNLNDFFEGLSEEEFKKLRSCDYSDLVFNKIFASSKHRDALNSRGGKKLLERLRNEETHFAFNDNFLSDQDFQVLDEFLLEFYQVLQENDLLTKHFGKRKSHIDSENNRLIPSTKSAAKGFSFKKQLSETKFTKEFKEVIKEQLFVCQTSTSFDMASAVYDQVESIRNRYSFDDVLDYVVCFQKHDLIRVQMNYQMVGDGYEGTCVDEPVIKIEWKE
ncbi:hypothetical protein SAMN02910400_01012 [Lachnospiraceae bacterium C10]|nr:hypothetical protein SAMN02910400_01012 [Lachnospiraceae bacterium C10]